MLHYVLLRTTAHSTEDVSRVMRALELFLPAEGDVSIEWTDVEGHYGNSLVLLQAKLKRSGDIRYFVELIRSRLLQGDLMRLCSELSERVDDECVLHMRFDKQRAFRGEVALATTSDFISAQLKVKAYPATRERAVEAASELLQKGS